MKLNNLIFAVVFFTGCSTIEKKGISFSGKGSPSFKRNGKLAEKVIQTDAKAPNTHLH